MSILVEHAEKELGIAGLFDADSDYEGRIGSAVLEIVELFADQGHSGFSGALVTELVTRLMRFENLTPLTDSFDEWMEVDAGNLWQSTRRADAFSHDNGKTYTITGNQDEVLQSAHG